MLKNCIFSLGFYSCIIKIKNNQVGKTLVLFIVKKNGI